MQDHELRESKKTAWDRDKKDPPTSSAFLYLQKDIEKRTKNTSPLPMKTKKTLIGVWEGRGG